MIVADELYFPSKEKSMEYVLKELRNEVAVERIANVHFFEFEKNFFTENERHPFCELVFVSAGELTVSSEDYSGRLSKNELILHRAGEMHSLTCSPDHSPTTIILGFEVTCEELSLFSHTPVQLRENGVRLLAEIVKEARQVFAPPYDIPTRNMKKRKDRPFGSEQLLRLLIEQFLIHLVREYRPSLLAGSTETRRASPVIHEVIAYVDENFLEKITIGELAFLFKTNRATLCREFKRETGYTLISYINEKKLSLAKEQITGSDDTFTEISRRMRFESVHYFTRFFKQHTGMTPKEYRRAECES